MTATGSQVRPAVEAPRAAFVVGCYRSGTTLVEQMLAAHPEVTSLGFETHRYTHIRRGRPLPGFQARQWERILSEAGASSCEDQHGGREALLERVGADATRSAGATTLVEKTPFHLFHVERILAEQPEARIVHVVRDGRDVVNSALASPWFAARTPSRRLRLLSASAMWELFAWEGLQLEQRGDRRLQTVRYEDLVNHPGPMMDLLAGHLGLDRSPAVVERWTATADAVRSNSSFGDGVGISLRSIGRWRDGTGLTPGEGTLVDRLLAPMLEAMGYEAPGRPVEAPSAAMQAVMALFRVGRVLRLPSNTGRLPSPQLWRYPLEGARRMRWARETARRSRRRSLAPVPAERDPEAR